VTEALAQRFAQREEDRVAIRQSAHALIDDLFRRYANTALDDPVLRVGRDPRRKLSRDDRLVGALELCHQAGLPHAAIAWHIRRALDWPIAADDPCADWWSPQGQHYLSLFSACTGLSPKDSIMDSIVVANHQAEAARCMRDAGIVLREDEAAALEIADFGLGRFAEFGLAIHVYVNTERCCAKELVMLPKQICPEHRHPSVDGELGKEETFRVRQGEVFLFLPGHTQDSGEKVTALAHIPADKQAAFTMYKCVHLGPGEQFTLKPNTPHWFVAGPEGAIVSEFSTRSRDEADVFTDTAIRRVG
jgi:D-lyxose ketol-isomerase